MTEENSLRAEVSHLPKQVNEETSRHHFYETLWKQVALEVLVQHADPAGLTLLDYGCGRGETLKLAADYGIEATGTDLDSECVSISCRYGKATLLEAPDQPLEQFGENSVDVVTCFHVLEHVCRPREVLSDLGKIARKFVVVAVPNLRSLPKPRNFLREPPVVNEGHLQGWDHSHFRNLVENHCGMEVIEWGFDHCKVPLVSRFCRSVFGESLSQSFEMGLFRKLFPFHCASVIALLKVSS